MSSKSDRPEPGTPEFEEWLKERMKGRLNDYLEKSRKYIEETGFEEAGLLSGGLESMNQTDAEAFPDELEEYQPHERAKIISSQDEVPEDKMHDAGKKQGKLKAVK